MPDFDFLFGKYHRSLLLYSLKFVNSENDALDIVQNIFASLWESGKYKQDEELVKAYLFISAKNSCLNYLKHQKIVRKCEHDPAFQIQIMEAIYYQTGEKSLIENENIQQINDAIGELADIYKEVIMLSRFERLKNHEIAEILHVPVRTVETRLYRALAILKEKLSKKSFFILFFLNDLKTNQKYF